MSTVFWTSESMPRFASSLTVMFPDTTIAASPWSSSALRQNSAAFLDQADARLARRQDAITGAIQPVTDELGITMRVSRGFISTTRVHEIAAEFGVEPSQQVQRIAMTSKRDLKRQNNPDDVMALPYALVANRQRFNIYAGNY